MDTDPQDELRKLIIDGERTINSIFHGERRLELVELARAMDHFFIGYNYNTEWTISEQAKSYGHLLAYGLHKALSLSLDESSKYPGAPLFRSTSESQKRANSILVFCGQLGYCEHLLELHRVGLVEITKVGLGKYHARPIVAPFGIEAHDRENFAWTRNIIATMDQEQVSNLSMHAEAIKEMMFERVDSWMDHYIQYTTTPEIDAFYQRLGLIKARMMIGNDMFPREAKFGGQEFGLYCATIVTLAGWSSKHVGFCLELLGKQPALELQNIVTITKSVEDQAESLSSVLEINLSTAHQLIEVITLTNENKKEHCSIAGNYISPAFIEIGQNKLLRPVWGSLSEPSFFLLRELRRRYRSDWDAAVSERELVFRNDLYSLLLSDRFYKLHRNANLKSSGAIITDIDAFILDRKTGEAGLFQLKWQDFIGNSMREREKAKRRICFVRVINGLIELYLGYQ